MVTGYCARSDSNQFLLLFKGSVLQNRDHVAANRHTAFFTEIWLTTVAKIKKIASPAQAQCAELSKWPTYFQTDSWELESTSGK